MKQLYWECAMGAAGDMLMGALYELCGEKERFLQDMNGLLPGVTLEARPVKRQGIAGTQMRVVIHGQEEGRHDHHDHHHEHHHEHHALSDIETMIDGFSLPQPVKENAKAVYRRIAAAESKAHGVEVGEVHFHEVGALDAVVDVTGVCYLLYLLAPDVISASPVTVGSGTVQTAHGLLPVPAPATAELLKGVPTTTGDIAAELCTPTGAALLRQFAAQFGPMPSGIMIGCGYGCGTKDFSRANCLRAFLVERGTQGAAPNGQVTELKANIDDMTGEELGFAMEKLLAEGALDVSYLPVQMKKNRPGVVLTCLCRPADADRLAKEMLRTTSTFGVRRTDCLRYELTVRMEEIVTSCGSIPCKTGAGYGQSKSKPEYAALAEAARTQGVTLEEAKRAFWKARS